MKLATEVFNFDTVTTVTHVTVESEIHGIEEFWNNTGWHLAVIQAQ